MGATDQIRAALAAHPKGLTRAELLACCDEVEDGDYLARALHGPIKRGEFLTDGVPGRTGVIRLNPDFTPSRFNPRKNGRAKADRAAYDHPPLTAREDVAPAASLNPLNTAMAAQAAADEPGVSAPNNPGSAPAELAPGRLSPGPSAAGRAAPAPTPSPSVRADGERSDPPRFLYADDGELYIHVGDEVTRISPVDLDRLRLFLDRVGRPV